MMPLIYFISGIIFIRFVVPLLDQLVSWIAAAIEYRKARLALPVAKIEKEIHEVLGETEEIPHMRQIGFVVDNPDEYNTDDSEEEDDN